MHFRVNLVVNDKLHIFPEEGVAFKPIIKKVYNEQVYIYAW